MTGHSATSQIIKARVRRPLDTFLRGRGRIPLGSPLRFLSPGTAGFAPSRTGAYKYTRWVRPFEYFDFLSLLFGLPQTLKLAGTVTVVGRAAVDCRCKEPLPHFLGAADNDLS